MYDIAIKCKLCLSVLKIYFVKKSVPGRFYVKFISGGGGSFMNGDVKDWRLFSTITLKNSLHVFKYLWYRKTLHFV